MGKSFRIGAAPSNSTRIKPVGRGQIDGASAARNDDDDTTLFPRQQQFHPIMAKSKCACRKIRNLNIFAWGTRRRREEMGIYFIEKR